MGQLERYGLYVLVVVIFLILGVAIMGGDAGGAGQGAARGELVARSPSSNRVDEGGGVDIRAPGPGSFRDPKTSEKLQKFLYEGGPQLEDSSVPPETGRGTPVDDQTTAVRQPETRPAPPAPDAGQPRTYVVQRGDSFAKIAREVYNDEAKYPLIASANPGVDPTRLQLGAVLVIPSVDDVPAVSKDAGRTATAADGTTIHVVQPGEIMGTIAKLHYGSATKWRRIAEANRNVDPNSMPAGTELRIPPAD